MDMYVGVSSFKLRSLGFRCSDDIVVRSMSLHLPAVLLYVSILAVR